LSPSRYKSKGNALLAALTAAFPDQSVTIAAGAPKRGSFDILVVADGASMSGAPRVVSFHHAMFLFAITE
jgi:hypothetical protein